MPARSRPRAPGRPSAPSGFEKAEQWNAVAAGWRALWRDERAARLPQAYAVPRLVHLLAFFLGAAWGCPRSALLLPWMLLCARRAQHDTLGCRARCQLSRVHRLWLDAPGGWRPWRRARQRGRRAQRRLLRLGAGCRWGRARRQARTGGGAGGRASSPRNHGACAQAAQRATGDTCTYKFQAHHTLKQNCYVLCICTAIHV